MAIKRIKRPRDPLQLAKLIGDIAAGWAVDKVEDGKNPAAVALGKLGGEKGGNARSESLSKSQRVEIAKKAAKSRWQKSN
jgi:hypothetical protein